jgi:hypothetical protein
MSSRAQAKTMRDAVTRRMSMLGLLVALVAINLSLTFAPKAQASKPAQPAPAGYIVAALPSGQIAGTVTAAATKVALAGIEVCAYSKFSEIGGEFGERCATTNSSGEYTVSDLPAADYTVEFYSLSGTYVTQYYDDRSSFLEATKVQLAEGAAVSGIDAAMAVAGEITGTVTHAAGGAPLEGIKVCAVETGGEFVVQCTNTGPTGEYAISRLPQAEYTADFYSLSGEYVSQYYDDKSSLAAANKVLVTEGTVTAGVDAAMVAAGEITGKVEEAVSEAPLEDIKVCAYESGGEAPVQCTSSSSSGGYAISRLAAAEYTVEFYAVSGEYVTQYYSDKSLFSEANKVSVKGGEVISEIDAAMTTSGQITGTVTDAAGMPPAPLEDIRVCAHESGGEAIVECAITNSSGEYVISRLPAAEYVVAFEAVNGAYLTQYYSDKVSFSEANKVQLAGGSTASGVDAAMQPLEDAAPPVNTAEAPKILGKPEVGAILTCSKGSWTGNPEPTFSYQWLRDGSPISGATSRFYAVQAVDQAHALVCEVTATNFEKAVKADSSPLDIPAETPANTELPQVYGTVSVGSILSCGPGTWTGNPRPTFTYQWLRGEVAIAGATNSTYTVQAADQRQALSCEVTGTNPAGVESVTSAQVSVPELSSGGNASGGSPPVGAGSVGVQSFISAKGAAVSVSGPITVKSGAIFVPLHCSATTGNCPAVTVQLTVVENVRGGHVTAITAAQTGKTTKRTVVVAKLSVTLSAGQSSTIKLTLNSAGKKLLAAHKKFAAKIEVEVEGASLKTQDVTIAKPAKKKH